MARGRKQHATSIISGLPFRSPPHTQLDRTSIPYSAIMGFKDPHQGAAAIVFLVVFTVLSGACLYALVRRRPKLRFIFLMLFCLIRVGGNIAAIGWATV